MQLRKELAALKMVEFHPNGLTIRGERVCKCTECGGGGCGWCAHGGLMSERAFSDWKVWKEQRLQIEYERHLEQQFHSTLYTCRDEISMLHRLLCGNAASTSTQDRARQIVDVMNSSPDYASQQGWMKKEMYSLCKKWESKFRAQGLLNWGIN